MIHLFKRKENKDYSWQDLIIVPIESQDFGPCPYCGQFSRHIQGSVNFQSHPIAIYIVHWTPEHMEYDACFELAIGKFGIGTSAKDRQAVSIIYHVIDSERSFMIVDADQNEFFSSGYVSVALMRDNVIGTIIAEKIFTIIDAIYMCDDRIGEIRNWG